REGVEKEVEKAVGNLNINTDRGPVHISCSVGTVWLGVPDETHNIESALKLADQQMYHTKRERSGRKPGATTPPPPPSSDAAPYVTEVPPIRARFSRSECGRAESDEPRRRSIPSAGARFALSRTRYEAEQRILPGTACRARERRGRRAEGSRWRGHPAA